MNGQSSEESFCSLADPYTFHHCLVAPRRGPASWFGLTGADVQDRA